MNYSDNHNYYQLSFLVGILPFVEQQSLWEMMSNPLATNSNGSAKTPPGQHSDLGRWYMTNYRLL